LLVLDRPPRWGFFAAYEAKYSFGLAASTEPTFNIAPNVVFAFCEVAELFVNSATRWKFGDES
jgi:hypothetical protein